MKKKNCFFDLQISKKKRRELGFIVKGFVEIDFLVTHYFYFL